jgi:DNA end-binding protein Ku
MVESYIDTLTGAVDQEEQVDRYRVALEQLVEAKAAGLTMRLPPGPPQVADEAVDLMEALRRSVAEAKRSRGAAPNGKAAADRPAPKRSGPVSGPVSGQRAGADKATPKAVAKKVPAKKATPKRAAKPPGR